ncbi:hypothetical protein FACS1894151_10230 [Spirochaetia bacterium]|nr:hypothetical protein FACS1894151_10230 [Spirochaetia bacterium]
MQLQVLQCKHWIAVLLIAFSVNGFIFSQQSSSPRSIQVSYERNFIRSDLAGKTDVLEDAATDENAPEFIGGLYELSLRFSLQYAALLSDDPDMVSLTLFAVQGAGRSGLPGGTSLLTEIFSTYRNNLIRVETLGALSLLGKGSHEASLFINGFILDQNARYRSGMNADYAVISAAISALSVLGSESSFAALFSVMTSGYPNTIIEEASLALSSIEGDFCGYLIEVIENNAAAEKYAAFRAGAHNGKFTVAERGSLAETALRVALEKQPANSEEEQIFLELRYLAAPVLRELAWVRSADAVLQHFYQTQREYRTGNSTIAQYREAIACLGAMGNNDAVQALALQLGYINSRTERREEFDDSLTMEVVNALGAIGDKVAFDYLLYMSYLPYSEQIQSAAREALNKLKW